MRIRIVTVGSRGDVQPYAALARRLMQAGHDSTLVTHERFRWLADQLSVPMLGLRHEPLQMYNRLISRRALLHEPRASWRAAKTALFAALDEWDAAVDGADFLLAHPKIFLAPELARRHGAAVAFADTLPVSCPTSEYPCCYVAGRSRGPLANRLSYEVLPWALTPLRRWAKAWLTAKGVSDAPRGRWDLFHRDGRPVPHLHGHSELVLGRPRDWPDAWSVTGYWHVAPPGSWQPEDELARFLGSGPAPVYVGFGSMVYRGDRRRLTKEIVRALVERGERVLLVRGWALADDDLRGDERVHFMDAYEGPWHSWLFQHVKAVVHHGGPGTFGAALRSGLPQICCPLAMDQPFWARRALELGVAPRPLPLRSWSETAWRSRVDALLRDESLAENARRIASGLSREDGAGAVVRKIEDIAADRLPRAARHE